MSAYLHQEPLQKVAETLGALDSAASFLMLIIPKVEGALNSKFSVLAWRAWARPKHLRA